MKQFRYPVDTDQFQRIRESGLLYVDKTDYIFDLVNERKLTYVFLARPRRFGKTLFCSTLKAYFQGQKELFDGLKLGALEKEWKTYPVLHFNMSGMKNLPVHLAKAKLESQISDYEKIYEGDTPKITPGIRLCGLIHNAYQQTGKKVVVLIDEYDVPYMHCLYDPNQLKAMHNLFDDFYQVLKNEGYYLKFVFITGVTKYTVQSIFSGLNNLYHISMVDDYSGICGITQEELDTTLRPCVEEYADDLHITTEEAYAILKKNYDGYRFSRNGQNVYTPLSLLRALDRRSTDYFWFESDTMSSLMEHLKHYPLQAAMEYEGMKVREEEFNESCEYAETPIPLLYQSGYLTIDNYDPRLHVYTLRIPNLEVRDGIFGGLMPLALKCTAADGDALISRMTDALCEGNLSGALMALRAYVAKIPYDVINKKKREEWEKQKEWIEWIAKEEREKFYQMLFNMTFSMLNATVDAKVKSIPGRTDVVIQTKTDVFVLELKIDDTVDNALAQIAAKGYDRPYSADGRRLTKCGVTVSSAARNLTHWRAVDAEDNLIDEQQFPIQEKDC